MAWGRGDQSLREEEKREERRGEREEESGVDICLFALHMENENI